MVALQQAIDARGARLQRRIARQQRGAIATPDPKIQLVAQKAGERGDGDDYRQCQMTARRRSARDQQNRFPFQKGARRHRCVTIGLHPLCDIHELIIFRL